MSHSKSEPALEPDESADIPQHFLQIDEEGYVKIGDLRVTDDLVGKQVFENLAFNKYGALVSRSGEKTVFVEAFDEPLVVRSMEQITPGSWRLLMPHQFESEVKIHPEKPNLSLDEWDRFHGTTTDGLPFVLSRAAQASFFNQLEEFDDTGIVVDGTRIEIPDWLQTNENINGSEFWSKIYNTEVPRWELEQPAVALKDILPQLKLPRAKILVLGCGSGNDATHLAQSGHIVTAVDISPEAITKAREKYGNVNDLNFIKADIFALPENLVGQFDIIFEHTCFCAVNPTRRNELIKTWKKVLRPGGKILGIFFVHPKMHGPPWGGSEWELRQRLTKIKHRPLYWTRWRQSIPRRMGKELVTFIELL